MQKAASRRCAEALDNCLDRDPPGVMAIEETAEASSKSKKRRLSKEMLCSMRHAANCLSGLRKIEDAGCVGSGADGYRMRAEEILGALEKHTAAARRDLEEEKAVAERAMRELEPCSVAHGKKRN